MSGGFLSKARLKVEHTSKISLGEFKLLGGILSSEKTLLNTHIRSSLDGKKTAAALDEWAQAEGADLADTLGKVAKLLGNDLARAEEEYAEHLNSYRLYFKGLRDREEKFSALRKNKHALQGRIDSTEKKLAKMSPENKELANTQNRLLELRNEMSGMEYAVMNEESALSDHRRQTARAAVNHKLAALCQLGEKLSIIGELGKLLVSEIPLERTEPGHDRAIYTSHERTQQIYGEAQTCLHGVNFDLSNSGNQGTSTANGPSSVAPQLPVPSAHEYDRSYDFDQEAGQRDSYEQAAQQQQQQQIASPLSPGQDSRRFSQGSQPSGNQGVSRYPVQNSEQAIFTGSATAQAAEETPSRSYQPLATPTHLDMESEFSDAVNASWREQQEQDGSDYYSAHRNQHAAPLGASDVRQEPIVEQEETATVSSVPKAVQASSAATLHHPGEPSGDAGSQAHPEAQSRGETPDAPPVQVTHVYAPPPPAAIAAAYGEEEDDEQDGRSLAEGSKTQANHVYGLKESDVTYGSTGQPHVSPPLPSLPAAEAESANSRYQGYTPQGDDLSGTGLYGNSHAVDASEEQPGYANEPESYDNTHNAGAASHLAPNVHTGSTKASALDSSELPSAQQVQQQVSPTHSPATSPHAATLPLSVSEIVSWQQSQRDGNSSTMAQQAPPPMRPSGPSSSQAPPAASQNLDSVPPSASPLPFPGSPAVLHDDSLNRDGRARTGTTPPPSSAFASQSSYQTIASSQSAHRQPSLPTPASPTRAKPVKQSSYRSEQRQSMTKRQDSSDYAQRSSIAYLNDTPHIEPPMRAPPPVTSLGPLPSTSPYFNSYATLRTSSYGKPDPLTPSLSESKQDIIAGNGRPKVASRKSDGRSSRGMGVDMRASQGSASSGTIDKPLLQQPRATTHASTYGSRDFLYGINEPGALAVTTGSGGRKLNAGAFRRVTPNRESSYLSSQGSGADGGISPAQRLRDEWRNSQSQLDTLAASQRQQQEQQQATPYATPIGTPSLAAGSGDVKPSSEDTSRYSTATEGMYDDTPHSSQRGNSNFTHRTSAIDAPVDVLPHETSHSTLRNLAADDQQVYIRASTSPTEEETQPLNLRKRSTITVEE